MEWVHVACAICGAEDADPIYRRTHHAGPTLGRFEKTDVLCNRCGFMYTSPRPSPEDMRRHYASASEASGSVFHRSEPGSRLHRLVTERVRFIESRLPDRADREPGRVLDVGCATGDLLAGLEARLPGWRRVGLEPSRSAARAAAARGIEVHEGDLEGAMPEGPFEIVTCISALEHFWDPRSALERIARALAPEGLLFVEVPDSLRPVAQIAEFYSWEHLSHFTRSSLECCLASVGLVPIAFDEEVGIPNLRVCARRAAAGEVLATRAGDDGAALRAAVDRHREARERFEQGLVERLGGRFARWRAEGARVGVYGAGMHTRFLSDLLDLDDAVACVFDSDPGKIGGRFLDWPVHGPEALAALDLDA
ncbi:MAG TPA: class I SAM-dependent methyltransferase, partial [Myxococcota bacterium]|nr:class I SAM-dependent methyltransferase [Myxococcota bacterium]